MHEPGELPIDISFKQSSLKLFLTTGLLIFFLVNVYSQRDFRPGYIIGKNGDTTKGYLLYKAVNTSSVCIFKTRTDEKQVEYTPADLSAFRFNDGKYYVQKEVPQIGRAHV